MGGGHTSIPIGRLKGKKAAFELSMTTVVVIVLAMVMLILGLTLVGKIFTGATGNVQELNDKVRDMVNQLIVNSDEELVFYLSGNTASIPQGTAWGVAFGFSPEESGKYTYETTVGEVSSTKCAGIKTTNAEKLVILGKSGSFGNVNSGDKTYGLIKIEIPKIYPLGCQIRYIVTIKGGTSPVSKGFDIEVVRKKVAGIF